MKEIIIVGNSHAGRECYYLFRDMLEHSPKLRNTARFKGFLSHKGFSGDLKDLSSYFLGSDTEYSQKPDDHFTIGIADTDLRHEVYEELQKKNAQFFTLISPFAQISRDVRLGEANIIGYGCAFSCNVRLGNANYCNSKITLGHDVCIGDYNFLGPDTMLLGGVTVGNSNRFGARSLFLENTCIGNNNIIAPASVIYKGCGSNKRMAGNPALHIG